jgi:hypothetical protein
MATHPPFPKRLYVRGTTVGDETILTCSEAPEDGAEINESVAVAVYDLREVGALETVVTYRHRKG